MYCNGQQGQRDTLSLECEEGICYCSKEDIAGDGPEGLITPGSNATNASVGQDGQMAH